MHMETLIPARSGSWSPATTINMKYATEWTLRGSQMFVVSIYSQQDELLKTELPSIYCGEGIDYYETDSGEGRTYS